MGREYFFKTENLVIWRPVGILDRKKIIDFITFLNEKSLERDDEFARFIDLSKISDVTVEYEELYEIASHRKQLAEKKFAYKVKIGFYVTDALSFGMARMYENLLDSMHYEIGIFYSCEEVAEFLQVDVAYLSE